MRDNAVEIRDLNFSYGKKVIYEGLSLDVRKGSVFALLGKNGVGKSTLINILMGYQTPKGGSCKILGEDSHNLSAATKERVALLHEGFVTYDFLSIEEIEEFFAPFYKKWKRELFFDLVDLMSLDYSQKISTMSFGQRSQVVLGLLFAQDADLLILDDYSMGLDAGYRRLFIDYLKDYIEGSDKTVLITSHVMQDLEGLVEDIAIVQRGGHVHETTMTEFNRDFKCYEGDCRLVIDGAHYERVEKLKNRNLYYSFFDKGTIESENSCVLEERELSFEDRFLGFVGKY